MGREKVRQIIDTLNQHIAKARHAKILLDIFIRVPDADKQAAGSIAEKSGHILENTKYLVSITGIDGRFVLVNSRWSDAFGWTFTELTTTPFFDYIHPDDIGKSYQAMEDISIKGMEVGEYSNFSNRYRTKTGEYRHVKWNVHTEYANNYFVSVAELGDYD